MELNYITGRDFKNIRMSCGLSPFYVSEFMGVPVKLIYYLEERGDKKISKKQMIMVNNSLVKFYSKTDDELTSEDPTRRRFFDSLVARVGYIKTIVCKPISKYQKIMLADLKLSRRASGVLARCVVNNKLIVGDLVNGSVLGSVKISDFVNNVSWSDLLKTTRCGDKTAKEIISEIRSSGVFIPEKFLSKAKKTSAPDRSAAAHDILYKLTVLEFELSELRRIIHQTFKES